MSKKKQLIEIEEPKYTLKLGMNSVEVSRADLEDLHTRLGVILGRNSLTTWPWYYTCSEPYAGAITVGSGT